MIRKETDTEKMVEQRQGKKNQMAGPATYPYIPHVLA
jgi:hypothetical protein